MAVEPRRILLIEDCTTGMSQTFSQLAFAGSSEIRLNLAANLVDAQRRLRTGDFSLILLSLFLPDSRGLETWQKFKAFCANIPIAVLLPHNEQHLADEARKNGAVAVFISGEVPIDEVIKLSAANREFGDASRENIIIETTAEAEVVEIDDVDELLITPADSPEINDVPINEEKSPSNETDEIKKLHLALQEQRAIQHEMSGVNRALEERCRELEAGQAALIEAEHLAIEREKAARIAVETQSSQMINTLRAKKNEYKNRLRDAEIKNEKAQSRYQKLTKNFEKTCAEKKSHQEKIEFLEKEIRRLNLLNNHD